MEKFGVEAIVANLSSFMGDMGKMDSAIKKLTPTNTLLGKTFTKLGDIISGLVSGVFRVLEFTLGSLIANGIQAVVGQLKELISTAIEGTTEFQKLEVRLNRLNLNDLTQEEKDLGLGMEYVIGQTQEQLKWTIQLGANTPFDSSDIANVYTLARTYGFANQEAQDLTTQITSFASGMGLSNEHIERIVQNFGQMKAAGKITGTEIRDLARGAFVPVNDILDSVAENLGITTDQLAVLRKKGLTDAEMFFAAFGQMVDHDFKGAAEDMNAVLAISISNIKEMARSFLGFNIIKPIFEGLATIVVSFQRELSERFDEFWEISQRIGKTLNEIITDITGGLPSVSTMADGLVQGLDRVADWLDTHKDDIVSWVEDAIAQLGKIRDFIFGTPAVGDKGDKREGPGHNEIITPEKPGALQKILDIVSALSPLVKPLTDLLGALGNIIITAFGGESKVTTESFSEFITTTLVPAIEDLTTWLTDNKETIAGWAKMFVIASFFVMLAVGSLGLFLGSLLGIVSAIIQILFYIAFFAGYGLGMLIAWTIRTTIAFLKWAAEIAALFAEWVASLILKIAIWATESLAKIKEAWERIKKLFVIKMTEIIKEFSIWKDKTVKKFKDTLEALKAIDWKSVGKSIVDGIVGYVRDNIGELASIISTAIKNAIDAAKAALDSGSPSRVFMDIGKGVMDGFALGIRDSTDVATRAMQKAVSQVAMPAFGAPAMAYAGAMTPSSSVNSTVNYNNTLNVKTNARSEPIISDFNMLQSLSGR